MEVEHKRSSVWLYILPILLLLCNIGVYITAVKCNEYLEGCKFIEYDSEKIRLITPEPYNNVFTGILILIIVSGLLMMILSVAKVVSVPGKIFSALITAVFTAFSVVWFSFASLSVYYSCGIGFAPVYELERQEGGELLICSVDVFGTRHVQVFVTDRFRAYRADGYSCPSSQTEKKRSYKIEPDTEAFVNAVIVTIEENGKEHHVRVYER